MGVRTGREGLGEEVSSGPCPQGTKQPLQTTREQERGWDVKSISVFLRGVLPPTWLSPNRGERKEGRAAFAISGAKMQMRADVATAMLAELRVQEITEPFDPCRITLTLVYAKRARDGYYRATDIGNAIYSLKAAIDGLIDAGLIVDDDHTHLVELTGRIERCASYADEGLRVEVEEVSKAL